MFVPNLKIITIRRKTGYRASKPIEKGGKKREEWKLDILDKRQKKEQRNILSATKAYKFKGRM